jgi:hydrogenase expression/formation protein HypE
MDQHLPVGKLPANLLAQLIAQAPTLDQRLLLGPGIGLDCAVLDMGPKLLALKTDPITFATEDIGWYAVQVNANDIATTGADPQWMLVTLLLPEQKASASLVERITRQVHDACREIGVTVIGGHTEIAHGLDRPILVGTMLGEVAREDLITPLGATPGDNVLLTKGIPIEATAILSREFPDRLAEALSPEELEEAQGFLFKPGISVLPEARLARQTGGVSAMHDPTEGGLLTAVWELAEACGHRLRIDPSLASVPELSERICQALGLDPWACIASGALLLTARPDRAEAIRQAVEAGGVVCREIGRVEDGPPEVVESTPGGDRLLPRPERDEIARMFE